MSLEPSPHAIQRLLTARALNADLLADRARISRSKLKIALSSGASLPEQDIEAVAEQLQVPVEALFTDVEAPTASAIDYRKAVPRPTAPDLGTLRAFAFVERFSGALKSLGISTELSQEAFENVETFDSATAVKLAKKWRTKWAYAVERQTDDHDASKVYASLREYVEGLGAFVVHFSFGDREVSGFYTRIDDGPHTIVINTTESNKARKTFTLAHEFCHLLTRKEGISQTSWIKNKIERFCNKFAATLLAPSSLIRHALFNYGRPVSAANDFIRLFSSRIGLSQEATFIRLVELGYLGQDSFDKWKAQFKGRIPQGDTVDPIRRGKPNPTQAKKTQYGFSLLRALGQAKNQGLIDEIDVYRIVGLKPAYQDAVFDSRLSMAI